jgi:hypothetical protein
MPSSETQVQIDDAVFDLLNNTHHVGVSSTAPSRSRLFHVLAKLN